MSAQRDESDIRPVLVCLPVEFAERVISTVKRHAGADILIGSPAEQLAWSIGWLESQAYGAWEQ